MNVPISPENGLYNKILSKEGAVALIAFMLVGFLMTIVYQGQQKHERLLTEIKNEETKQTYHLEKSHEVLEDIRFSLREDRSTGLTFRNNPTE